MAKLLINILFLLVVIGLNDSLVAADETISCGGVINGASAYLSIPTDLNNCKFTSAADTKVLMLDTDGLFLAANDVLEISSSNTQDKFVYAPPTDAGYLRIGGHFAVPSLEFKFQNATHPSMLIKFSVGQDLQINADINHNFKIMHVGQGETLEVKFTKTLNESVHIEVYPSDLIPSAVLGNQVMNPDTNYQTNFLNPMNVEDLIHIKTTIVEKTCSHTFSSLNNSQEIIGPAQMNKSYQCVNLFKFDHATSKEAHFDVDFSNFISLAADTHEMTIRDSSRRLFIDKTSEMLYRARRVSNSGPELVVIYTAPTGNTRQTGLRLTVIPEQNGGVVRGKQQIKLPSSDAPTIYTLVPDDLQCTIVRPIKQNRLGLANLTLSLDGGAKATLGPNILLPPIIGTSNQLILSYSGKSDLNLDFLSQESCCHKLSLDQSSSFSVDGGQKGSCIWTLAMQANSMVRLDEYDLGPDGCVTIQSLSSDKPIYSRCNIKPNEAIPSFVVSQAYVNVSLPTKGRKFTASILEAPAKLSLYEGDSSTSYIQSSVSYPVISGGQEVYSLNASNRNYLINVADLDLRVGEKLLVDKDEINPQNLMTVGDLILSNKTTDITITRPTVQTDFSARRGLKITLIAFKDIRVSNGNITANNSIVLDKLSNSLIKISSLPSKIYMPPRINYNITLDKPAPEGLELKLYDGRSISSPISATLGGKATSLAGSTTSGTLMLIVKASKPDLAISQLTISYSYSSCNVSDDLVCDNSTRCVPREFQCKGKFYCIDGSDAKQICNSIGPLPPQPPNNNQSSGVGGPTVFILCVLMLTLGVLLSTYGPGLYKTLEDRFRGPGQYNSFTSVE